MDCIEIVTDSCEISNNANIFQRLEKQTRTTVVRARRHTLRTAVKFRRRQRRFCNSWLRYGKKQQQVAFESEDWEFYATLAQ
jgi:hypothetical protein